MHLLLLDKDGTLIQPRSGRRFVRHPQDQELMPGVKAAIAQYAAQGWKMAIVSNQGGVAAGHKTLEDAIAEMAYCLELLPQIEVGFFCPDFEGNDCWRVRRKNPEFIGDKPCEAIQAITWCVEDDRWIPDTIYSLISPSQVVGRCRKPEPGMLILAQQEYVVATRTENQLPQTLMVGDRPEDEQAAQAAGVDFLWAQQWRQAHSAEA
jgi:D-glycero-D-manno-heptose 1,7-bisphosphate phosphatase